MADARSPTSRSAGNLSSADEERMNVEENQGIAAYWCHQCNKEVIAEAEAQAAGNEGGQQAMVCPDCRSGFIEMMATAQSLPDVRLAQRRHRRRRVRASDLRDSGQIELPEEADDPYPLQVLRLLRLLARTTRNSHRARARHTENERSPTSQGSVQDIQEHSELQGPSSSLPSSPSIVRGDGPQEEPVEHGAHEGQFSALSEIADSMLGQGEATDAAEIESILIVGDTLASQEDEIDEDEESDSEAEARLLELGDWDSLDEEDDEEWEEVDSGEVNVARMTLEDGGGQLREENPAGRDVEDWEDRLSGDGEEQHFRVERSPRSRNIYRNVHHRLQEILRNLEGHNFELRLEIPEFDTYVGNPGDYVDARGFEQLLQQLLDNDNSRRGAPPAAKASVEGLPSIMIQQKNVDDGSALCAICKDVVALGKPAKQLPCLHLYHDDCIVPWLGSRNSCPVCRYELPTDDLDYEEQKGQNMHRASNPGSGTEAGSYGSQDFYEDNQGRGE